MKRAYSGYWNDDQRKSGRQKLKPMQFMPFVLTLALFMAYMLLSGKLSFGGGGSVEAVENYGRSFRVYYAVKDGDGYRLSVRDIAAEPVEGMGVLYLFEKFLKETPAGSLQTLDSDVYINSIASDGKTAELDLTAAPIGEVGDDTENARLLALAYTIGEFFNVCRVRVTVKGEPSPGGDGLYKDGTIYLSGYIK